MIAILLAAGSGRRLSTFTDDHPKVLVPVGGRSLLDRHLDALAAIGVQRVTLVVGRHGDQVRAALARRPDAARVQLVDNRDHALGSVLSLHAVRRQFDQQRDGALVLNADLLLPMMMLAELYVATGTTLVLEEGPNDPGGDAPLAGVKGGAVRALGPDVGKDCDLVGRLVGMFKIASRDAPLLRGELERSVALGDTAAGYEEALARLLRVRPANYVLAGSQPWIEINTPDDLARAESVVAAIDATYEALG